MGSSGCRACIPTTARCSTSSATTAITASSISSPPTAPTTAGGRDASGPCTRARASRRDCSRAKNRATGYASTAGKMAAAFALGARLFDARAPDFARTLRRKAVAAYALGERHPGACQTAPGRSPYFYEEDNWVDDMELGAAMLHQLTGDARYQSAALGFAAREPVTPWLGADTGAPLPVVSVAQRRTLRGVDARRDGRPCAARALLSRGSGARRAPRGQRLPRRHPVHLVLERSHGLRRDAGRLLPADDGRPAVRRAGAGRDRLAVRRQPVGHVDGDRRAARRRHAARPAHAASRLAHAWPHRRARGRAGVLARSSEA